MSSFFLPPNTSLKLSDNNGNITHRGVLGSNALGTAILTPTFPTTQTGDSIGHYHYTEATTNALQFLNASGSGIGGHHFYASNSTTAPIQTAKIDANALTIDKSSGSGGNVVYSPNIASLSDNGKGIVFPSGTNLTQPPYNFNQTFNPIYMTQTTGLFTTGDLAYAVLADNESIQIFNNNNNTNPIPPNVVPSDFGNFSNVGITTGIPIFSLSLPSPSVPQIINLLENLTITTDTDTSILSARDLTFNNVSLKSQVASNTTNIATINSNISALTNLIIKQTNVVNQGISAAIYADGRPMTAPPSVISQQYAFSPSWYFKNTVAGYKVNWYMGGFNGMTVADVLGLYMNVFNVSTNNRANTPFIQIYTQAQSGDPFFYRSKRTYTFNNSVTPVVNTRYFNFANVSGTCPTPSVVFASTLINMQLSSEAGSNIGPFAPTEFIYAFTIATNSASVVNSVEFAVNKFGMMTPNGTQELLFIPS